MEKLILFKAALVIDVSGTLALSPSVRSSSLNVRIDLRPRYSENASRLTLDSIRHSVKLRTSINVYESPWIEGVTQYPR
jgi:hypothetical protein